MATLKKFLFIFLLVAVNLNVYSATLDAITVKYDNKSKNIFFKISGNYHYKAYSLHNPERLVIDIDYGKLSYSLKHFTIEDDIIKRIRYGNPTANILRVVLDLKHQIRFSASKTKINNIDNILITTQISNNTQRPIVKK